jgi:spermidine synthase
MAARELLKYRQIQTVDLVDPDEEMIRLFRDHPLLSQLCSGSLSDQRVTVHIEDAGKFMEATTQSWDLIFIDLPDPTNLALSRLYTTSTYRLIAKRLGVQGVIVTQATSPFYAPEAFWCIARTWAEAPVGPEGKDRLNVYPYHVYVPSFGDWGFVMATGREIEPRNLRLAEVPLKFLTSDVLPTLFTFPKDSLSKSEVQANRMDDQVLVQYYRMAWRRYNP